MQPTDASIFSLVWQQFWQCSVLVLIVWVICRFVRFRRSHLTCLLWLIVLLKFITPPVWSSTTGLFCWIQTGLPAEVSTDLSPPEPELLTQSAPLPLLTGDDTQKLSHVEANADFKVTIHENETSRQAPAAVETAVIPVKPAVAEKIVKPPVRYSVKEIGVLVWMTVGILIATVMLVRYLRCWHILRSAGEQKHPELNRLLTRLSVELKLKRSVRLLITTSRMGPAVIGLLRPTIILPTAITESRSLEELEPVLAHELIHIRRGDLWIGLLQLLASVVWWFHPLVWFTGRRLKFEIEQCCDEEVLAELNCDPRQYAACLLEILELKQTLKTVPVVPGVRPVEITSKRLERIMRLGQGCQKRTPWWCWMIFVMLAAVVLPGAAFVVNAAKGDPKSKLNESELITSKVTIKKNRAETIDQLPFYHPLKQKAHQADQSFNKNLSTDLDYLSPEIDLRGWVSRTGCVRSYPVGTLLEKSRQLVGADEAKKNLSQLIQKRIAKLKLNYPDQRKLDDIPTFPLFIGPHQIPLKDNRVICRGHVYCMQQFYNDQLHVWSPDPRYHQCVKQVLSELSTKQVLAELNAEQDLNSLYVLTARIMSVPTSQLNNFSSQRRNVRIYQGEQIPELPSELKDKLSGTENSENVSQASIVCEVLDTDRINEVQALIKTTAGCQLLSQPQVSFLDGQTVQIETKKNHTVPALGIASHVTVSNLATGYDLRLTYSTEKGINGRGMLEYQIAKSEIAGLKRLKMIEPGTDDKEEFKVPVSVKRHFKDAMLIEPGKALLLGGLKIDQPADQPRTLLLMFKLEKAEPLEEREILQGQGINSDAGVTGQLQLDESHFKDALITYSYPVAGLVVPVQRKMILGTQNFPYHEQPRFEPLIKLIKQNVTPEAWGDPRKTGRDIRPYPEKLSLVIRAKRETHNQIKDLLAKLREAQDRQVGLKLDLVTADYLNTEFKKIDQFASRLSRELWQKLKSEKLDEGVLLSPPETQLLLKMSSKVDDMEYRMSMNLTLFNGQSFEFNLPDSFVPDEKSKSLLQLRPELLKDRRIRLSYVINARNALDALSHLHSITIPQGQTLLVDLTDQLSRDDSSFLFDQFVRQAELSYQKQSKRCFMLVTPTILTASAEVPAYRDPQQPQSPEQE